MKLVLFELHCFIWNLFIASFVYKESKSSFYVKCFSSLIKILCLFKKYHMVSDCPV
jgi:hypothetical protein